MATIEELSTALVKADAAGNADDAKFLADSIRAMQAQARPATQEQKVRASIPARFAAGLMEPLVGAGQLLAHGISAISPEGSADLAGTVDRYWKDQAAQQEAAKEKLGVGADVVGFAGNVLSPANALLAAKGITAAGVGMKMLQGAGMGAAAGAMQPVMDGGDFATTKLGQAGMGAVTGGAMTGIINAVAGKAIGKLARVAAPENAQTLGVKSAVQTDAAISDALKEVGMDRSSIDPAHLQAIRNHVLAGMKEGQQLDAAALLRKQDFDMLGIQPLQGQITRDPLQFAKERNLRGIVPELSTAMQTQGQQMRDKIGGVASGASDAYNSGNALIDALRTVDNAKRGEVSNLYQAARADAGKDLELPLQGLAQDYASVVDRFGSQQVPPGIRNQFDAFGLNPSMPSNQRKIFTVEDADKLLKVINDNDPGYANKPVATLAGQLRAAVKKSVTDADASGGVFAPAVKAASDRFKLLDAVPSLEAASSGTATPDNFVSKFIVNGKTDEVKAMAELLKQNSIGAFDQARAQVGETLKRAAFGENVAGDAPFSPERFAKAIRSMGKDKLGAFFSPAEIDDMNRLSRVGAYINKIPDVAPVNTSNTFTAQAMNPSLIGNVLGMIPGKGAVVGAAKAATGAVKNQMAASNAMNTKIPSKAAELTPDQRQLIARLLGAGAVGGGVAAGGLVK